MLKAILDHPTRQGDPLTLTVNFAAPVQNGRFTIEARPLRTNRSTQHWFVTMQQAGTVVATATAVCATRRETWSDTERPFPNIPPAADCLPVPNDFTPPWTKMYEFRAANGIGTFFGIIDAATRYIIMVCIRVIHLLKKVMMIVLK